MSETNLIVGNSQSGSMKIMAHNKPQWQISPSVCQTAVLASEKTPLQLSVADNPLAASSGSINFICW